MAAPRKYSEELKDRAMRMALDARRDPESRVGAIKRIADQLGIRPEALRTWVRQAEVDDGIAPGTTTADAQRIADLEREVRELRRANEILATGSGSSRSVASCVTRVCRSPRAPTTPPRSARRRRGRSGGTDRRHPGHAQGEPRSTGRGRSTPN